jgi:hypothetical protein
MTTGLQMHRFRPVAAVHEQNFGNHEFMTGGVHDFMKKVVNA